MKREHYVFGGLAAVLLLLFTFESYLRGQRYWGTQSGMMSGAMGEMMGSMTQGFGMMSPGFFGMGWSFLLFWVLLIVFAVYLLTKGKEKPGENDKAAAILRERYAKGEITREEYLQTFRDLKEGK